MIKSSWNQLGNVGNPYQGSRKKVLAVCSAGMLRSPTIARVLADKYDYNTRSCGVTTEFALVPISEALVHWADEIVFAEQRHMEAVLGQIQIPEGVRCVVLNIPDEYEYMETELVDMIKVVYSAV